MGQKHMMIFPGDSTPVPVPQEAVEAAKAAGAKQWQRPRTAFGQVMPSERLKAVMNPAPTAGAIAGSTVGGIIGGGLLSEIPPAIPYGAAGGRMVGGVLGGVLGKLAQERAYQSVGEDAPGSVGGEAAFQAIAGPAGEGIALGAQGAGRALIRTGLPARLANSGRVVSEMVKERLPIGGIKALDNVPLVNRVLGRGSRFATENYERRLMARNTANIAAGPTRSGPGVSIPAQAAEDEMVKMAKEYAGRGDRTAQLRNLARRYADFKKTWAAGSLSPEGAQAYLTSLDEEAKPIFESISKGERVTPAERRIANQAKRVADEIREQMHTLVPGHRETSRLLGNAISAKDAISAAENAGLKSLGSRFATGAAITGAGEALAGYRNPGRMSMDAAAAGALLASPAILSRMGLALTDPRMLYLLRNAPRGFAAQYGESNQ